MKNTNNNIVCTYYVLLKYIGMWPGLVLQYKLFFISYSHRKCIQYR